MQVLLRMIDWNSFDPADFPDRGDDADRFRDLYLCKWEPVEYMWVVPHGHILDQCAVALLGDIPDTRGYIRVEGRGHDGAFIRSKVPARMLTRTPPD